MQIKLLVLFFLLCNFHFFAAMQPTPEKPQGEKPQVITCSKEDWERAEDIIEALDRAQPLRSPSLMRSDAQLREEAEARQMHDEIVETMLITAREQCSGWGSCGIPSPVKPDPIWIEFSSRIQSLPKNFKDRALDCFVEKRFFSKDDISLEEALAIAEEHKDKFEKDCASKIKSALELKKN